MPHATLPAKEEQEGLIDLATAAVAAIAVQKKAPEASEVTASMPSSGPSTRPTDSPLISSATRPVPSAEPVTTKMSGWDSNSAADWGFSGKPARTPKASRQEGNETTSSTPASASLDTTRDESSHSSQTTCTCPTTPNNEVSESSSTTSPPASPRTYADLASCSISCAECIDRSSPAPLQIPTLPSSPQPYDHHLMPVDISNPYIIAEIAHHRYQDSRSSQFHGNRVKEMVGMLECTGTGRKEWEDVIWKMEDDVYDVIETEEGGMEEQRGMNVDAWQGFMRRRRYILEGTVLERRGRRS